MSNTSNMIIQIGESISSQLGNDYYKCGDGDYYGSDSSNLHKDLIYSGYNNGACTYTTTSQSVMMTYTRDIYTFDTFDSPITQSLKICLIGTQNHCTTLSLPLIIPSMTVFSALTISEPYLNHIRFIWIVLLWLLIV